MSLVTDALSDIVTALLVGLVNGTVFAVIALGIVLIYKAQRVINFAQAEFATAAAFALYFFVEVAGLPYLVAGFLAVSTAVLLAVVVERGVVRPLRDAPDVTVYVATAGVALFLIALTVLVGDANIRGVASVFSFEDVLAFSPLLNLLSPQRVLVLVVLAASAGGLGLFFARSPYGKALLAMSREPFAVRLAGISTAKMSVLTWGLAGLLAGLAGVASIPTTPLLPGVFTSSALVPALTACVVGGLTSLPGAVAGGLLVGLVAAFASQAATRFFPGIPAPDVLAVFLLLLVTLLVRPQGLLAREA